MRIAHFADSNSFSFVAASEYGEEMERNGERVEYLSCPTMAACFEAIESGMAQVCVVPLENSVEGAVNETMDLLSYYTAYIVKQIVVKISHCLVGVKDESIENIKTVCSHYQALAQCREFLQTKMPTAVIMPLTSTSEALNKVKSGTAAIARKALKNQSVLASDIQDYKSNATKFVVLRALPTFEGDKCSMLFETLDEPGALLKVLSEVARHGINMTKIESRPQKSAIGRYIFFADLDFPYQKEELTKFLASLQECTTRLKFLGKYDANS